MCDPLGEMSNAGPRSPLSSWVGQAHFDPQLLNRRGPRPQQPRGGRRDQHACRHAGGDLSHTEAPGPDLRWKRRCRRVSARVLRPAALEEPVDDQPRFADVAQAAPRLAIEAALEQPADLGRCRRWQPGEVDLGPDHIRQGVRGGLALEQPLPGEHLEQHDAEGPDVGAFVHRRASGLFGTHVGRGAHDDAGPGRPAAERCRVGHCLGRRCFQRLGETEVEQLDAAVRQQLDVGRLEVAVDDAVLVGGFQRLGNLRGGAQRLGDGQGPCLSRSERSIPSTSSITSALLPLESSRPYTAAIEPWLSEASTCASRSKRAMRSGSLA